MAHKIVCPKCSSALRLSAVASGKKIRCPKCQNIFAPDAADEPEMAEAVEEGIAAQPLRKNRTADVVEEVIEEADELVDESKESPKKTNRKSGDWKPCPRCDSDRIKKVTWTPWGSFYGPLLLSHVRCLKCGYAYNGKSGRSNLVAAIVFVSVPLGATAAVLVWLFFYLKKLGYF